MISIQIQDVRSAEPVLCEGSAWVTLRFADESRVVFHTLNFTQAVAIADAINSEAGAREEPA